MEIRHLHYFKAVAEELHFRKAAARLFISQPPLSRQIKELEEELGVNLFSRDNKRVALTDAGKYFKVEVDVILSKLEESKSIVKQIHSAESGEFKIGYISSVYQTHLAEVLKQMHQQYPHIKTSLYEVPTVTQVLDLEQGLLDVGILRAPVHSKMLTVKSLFFDPFIIVIPATGQQFKNHGELVDFIKNSPFIFFNKEFAPQYYDKLLEICERMGFKPDITHEANNVHSILQLVEARLGISILPASLKRQYTGLKLDFFELEDIPVNTEVVLAYKASNKSAGLKWFIDNYNSN